MATRLMTEPLFPTGQANIGATGTGPTHANNDQQTVGGSEETSGNRLGANQQSPRVIPR